MDFAEMEARDLENRQGAARYWRAYQTLPKVRYLEIEVDQANGRWRTQHSDWMPIYTSGLTRREQLLLLCRKK